MRTDNFLGNRLSQEALRSAWNVAAGSSWYASYAVVDSWLTDFRSDIEQVTVRRTSPWTGFRRRIRCRRTARFSPADTGLVPSLRT